jgi:predicted RNA-binding Zn-ribbon protein involved in translation (DUF1610 family)
MIYMHFLTTTLITLLAVVPGTLFAMEYQPERGQKREFEEVQEQVPKRFKGAHTTPSIHKITVEKNEVFASEGYYPTLDDCSTINYSADIVDTKGNVIAYFRKKAIPQDQIAHWTAHFESIPEYNGMRGLAAGPLDPKRLDSLEVGEKWEQVDTWHAVKINKDGTRNTWKKSNRLKTSSVGFKIKGNGTPSLNHWSESYKAKYLTYVIPFFEAMSEYFQQIAPTWYEEHKHILEKQNNAYRIGNSVFTLGTFNLGTPNQEAQEITDSQTACHRDVNHADGGSEFFAVLGQDIQGGELVFPDYNIALKLSAGDIIVMKGKRDLHGNTPLLKGKKLSAILYIHQKHEGYNSSECLVKPTSEPPVQDFSQLFLHHLDNVTGSLHPVENINPCGDPVIDINKHFTITLTAKLSPSFDPQTNNADKVAQELLDALLIKGFNVQTNQNQWYASSVLFDRERCSIISSEYKKNDTSDLHLEVTYKLKLIRELTLCSQNSKQLYTVTLKNEPIKGLEEIFIHHSALTSQNNVPCHIIRAASITNRIPVIDKALWYSQRQAFYQEHKEYLGSGYTGKEEEETIKTNEHNENKYKCDYPRCTASFTAPTNVRRHKRVVHFLCTECSMQHTNEQDLKDHRRKAHKQLLKPGEILAMSSLVYMACPNPSEGSKDPGATSIGSTEESQNSAPVTTTQNSDKELKSQALENTLQPQTEDIPQSQCACWDFSGSEEELKAHIKLFHSFKENERTHFSCPECSKKEKNITMFMRHALSHTGEKLFQCDQCSYKTGYKNDLTKHKRKKHRDSSTTVASTVEKESIEAIETQVPVIVVPSINKEELQSTTLEQSTSNNSSPMDIESSQESIPNSLLSIVKEPSSSEKEKSSNAFEYALSNALDAAKNLTVGAIENTKRTHQANQALSSCACGNFTGSAEELKAHLTLSHSFKENKRTHFTCPKCTKIKKDITVLIYHMRKHTGEKPYKCDECEYITARPNDLNVHKRIHRGEFNYKCTYEGCNHATYSSSRLTAHMKQEHKKQLEK